MTVYELRGATDKAEGVFARLKSARDFARSNALVNGKLGRLFRVELPRLTREEVCGLLASAIEGAELPAEMRIELERYEPHGTADLDGRFSQCRVTRFEVEDGGE